MKLHWRVFREIVWDFESRAHCGEVGWLRQEFEPLQPCCIRHPVRWVLVVFHEMTSFSCPFGQKIFLLGGFKASSNTQRTEKKMTDVVIHQHSRKLLKMDILMSETFWAHNKWNKIASDIKLVFHSSTSKGCFICLRLQAFYTEIIHVLSAFTD